MKSLNAPPHSALPPQLMKLLQDLMTAVAVNCRQHSDEDMKVVETLVGLRLKTRLFSAQYISCIK